MIKYYKLLKNIPCGYIKGHLFKLKGENIYCSWETEQKDSLINWSDDIMLAISDLKMTEYFEESIGISADGYVLFKGDKVYPLYGFSFNLNTELNSINHFITPLYFKKENIPVEKILPKSWEDLKSGQGYYHSGNNIYEYNGKSVLEGNKNVYKTESQAKSSFAYAQLSQLVAEMNQNKEFDWENSKQNKYSIIRFSKGLRIDCNLYTFTHLPFHKKEHAEFSLIHHKNLWEAFYELTTTE